MFSLLAGGLSGRLDAGHSGRLDILDSTRSVQNVQNVQRLKCPKCPESRTSKLSLWTSSLSHISQKPPQLIKLLVMIPESAMDELTSPEVLQLAFDWLCEQRKNYSANSDVWDVRWNWESLLPDIQEQLRAGRYRFSPLRRIRVDGQVLEVWSAQDALVLKAMAIVLGRYLKLSQHCCHLKGHGGAKRAVRVVVENLTEQQFVFRTDVKSYYASIRHEILFEQLQQRINDPRLLDLLWQYMRRTIYDDGEYEDVTQGISLGCPLSPIMGAVFLDILDQRMEATGHFYRRFMDDWVILAPTRWKLRKAVALVNRTLEELCAEQHPDKTFIGRLAKGFEFLGYKITPSGLVGVARKTCDKFVERVNQLYEQGASGERIGEYVKRWQCWVRAGLQELLGDDDRLDTQLLRRSLVELLS